MDGLLHDPPCLKTKKGHRDPKTPMSYWARSIAFDRFLPSQAVVLRLANIDGR
jgi:hypothetical protein